MAERVRRKPQTARGKGQESGDVKRQNRAFVKRA